MQKRIGILIFQMTQQMADALRKAIRGSGLSAAKLAALTGVPQPTITRFLLGQDMRISRAQKIADYFGLELQDKPRRRQSKPSP